MTRGAVPMLAHDVASDPDEIRMPSEPTWRWYRFEELPPRALYDVLRLRQSVFVVEQDVAYADIDGKDLDSLHLVGRLDDELVAYLRVLPQNLFKFGSYSLGRVIVRRTLRRSGLGRNLVTRGLAHIDARRGDTPIEISSQFYLKRFYESFGFVAYGDTYIEDKIPHIAMCRR